MIFFGGGGIGLLMLELLKSFKPLDYLQDLKTYLTLYESEVIGNQVLSLSIWEDCLKLQHSGQP